jgi:hypothetical protein
MSYPKINNSDNMQISVPFQQNSWDCGVFVCMYAYALYETVLDVETLTYRDARCQFKVITLSAFFDFDSSDIIRLRREMKELIQKLSDIYLPWKKSMDQQEKLESFKVNMTTRNPLVPMAEADVVLEPQPPSNASEAVTQANIAHDSLSDSVERTGSTGDAACESVDMGIEKVAHHEFGPSQSTLSSDFSQVVHEKEDTRRAGTVPSTNLNSPPPAGQFQLRKKVPVTTTPTIAQFATPFQPPSPMDWTSQSEHAFTPSSSHATTQSSVVEVEPGDTPSTSTEAASSSPERKAPRRESLSLELDICDV